jgi:hypothetical protein
MLWCFVPVPRSRRVSGPMRFELTNGARGVRVAMCLTCMPQLVFMNAIKSRASWYLYFNCCRSTTGSAKESIGGTTCDMEAQHPDAKRYGSPFVCPRMRQAMSDMCWQMMQGLWDFAGSPRGLRSRIPREGVSSSAGAKRRLRARR